MVWFFHIDASRATAKAARREAARTFAPHFISIPAAPSPHLSSGMQLSPDTTLTIPPICKAVFLFDAVPDALKALEATVPRTERPYAKSPTSPDNLAIAAS